MTNHRALIALAACLAVPTAASAAPNVFRLDVTLTAGQNAALTVGPVTRGEFAFVLRASSDDTKRVTVTQRRTGGRAFTVINTADPARSGTCGAAAGTIVCRDITTPATPDGRTWTFTATNRGTRPTTISLQVRWRRVASAG